MRVKILPPQGCDRSALDERSWAEMDSGSTVRDALKLIKCSRLKAKILLVSVNGERASMDTKLNDGDVIGFIAPVTGG